MYDFVLRTQCKWMLMGYYSKNPTSDEEIICLLNHIRVNGASVLPYDFKRKYEDLSVECRMDFACNMFYVMHQGKKMYFPSRLTRAEVIKTYISLITEQDIDSPHQYVTADFTIEQNSVLVDVGAAEGIFALTHIDRTAKAYLFDCEQHWVAALNETFKPWKDKVKIIKKFASSIDSENEIRLDTIVERNEYPLFIKLDVEGTEAAVLEG
ncbi:MAG: hypothetical protein WCQ44_11775, partial [Opitutaceae bacterium]